MKRKHIQTTLYKFRVPYGGTNVVNGIKEPIALLEISKSSDILLRPTFLYYLRAPFVGITLTASGIIHTKELETEIVFLAKYTLQMIHSVYRCPESTYWVDYRRVS